MPAVSRNSPCPCGSSLKYRHCCGMLNNDELQVLARLDASQPELPASVPEPIRQAWQQRDTSPTLFPMNVNMEKDQLELVMMSPQWFREAVFLNAGRCPGKTGIAVDLEWFRSSVESAPRAEMRSIFHTAFCGSTLMTRALEQQFQADCLREPMAQDRLFSVYVQGRLDQAAYQDILLRLARLMLRPWPDGGARVIKCNDLSNTLLVDWHSLMPDARSLVMYLPLEDFILASVKHPTRVAWINARYRAFRASFRLHWPQQDLPEADALPAGAQAAFYWCHEMRLLNEALQRFPGQLRSLSIDALLAEPGRSTQAAGQWLRLKPRPDADDVSSVMGTHAKVSDASYGPAQRREDMRQQAREFSEELEAGLAQARQLGEDPQALLPVDTDLVAAAG